MEYGVLVYDVPDNGLRTALRQRIRRFATMVNYSVYLMPWGHREAVLKIAAEVEKDYPSPSGKPNVAVLKFDPASEQELRNMAQAALAREVRDLGRTVLERLSRVGGLVAKALENGTLKSGGEADAIAKRRYLILQEGKRRIQDLTTLIYMFALNLEPDLIELRMTVGVMLEVERKVQAATAQQAAS